MKRLFHRVASSRPFILTVAVVAFGALELLFVQHAFAATKCCTKNSLGQFTTNCYCDAALPCNTGFSSTGKSCPLPYTTSSSTGSSGGTINSQINCLVISGTNSVDLTTVSQSAIVQCTVTADKPGDPLPPNAGTAICELQLSYFRGAGLTTQGTPQCVANSPVAGQSTLTDVAFCGNASSGLVVSGTLNCNPPGLNNPSPPNVCGGFDPCIMNLDGIPSVPNGQCGSVFPAVATTNPPLLEGQVLRATLTTDDTTCTGQIVGHSNIVVRYCNSGKFDPELASQCIFGTGSNKSFSDITGETTVFIPAVVQISPNTINVACGGNKDEGDVRFTIFGSEILDPALIQQGSLRVEGTNDDLTCNPVTDLNGDTFVDLSCTVSSCPTLGPVLLGQRVGSSNFVDVTITGSLQTTQTQIAGEQNKKTSP